MSKDDKDKLTTAILENKGVGEAHLRARQPRLSRQPHRPGPGGGSDLPCLRRRALQPRCARSLSLRFRLGCLARGALLPGLAGHGKQCGVASLPSNKIVAPCTRVEQGEGTDGALIVVCRVSGRREGDGGEGHERIIICLLGYSGSGTDAAARLATNPADVAGL